MSVPHSPAEMECHSATCANCKGAEIMTTVVVVDDTVLSHGERWILEREFFCPNCREFVDVHENQNDIVCDKCNWIIASFRDRPVISPAPTSAGVGGK